MAVPGAIALAVTMVEVIVQAFRSASFLRLETIPPDPS